MSQKRVPGGTETNDDGELDPSEIHDVLRNDRRRRVLERLRAVEDAETVRDLSEHIAGIEAGEFPAPRDLRQSVYVSLHQTHLPKLDELGIVEYDGDTKEVRLDDRANEVAIYLEVVPKYGLSWGEYYLGLGLLGLLLLFGRTVGVPVLATADASLLGIVPLALLVLSAAYHVGTQGSTLLDRVSR